MHCLYCSVYGWSTWKPRRGNAAQRGKLSYDVMSAGRDWKQYICESLGARFYINKYKLDQRKREIFGCDSGPISTNHFLSSLYICAGVYIIFMRRSYSDPFPSDAKFTLPERSFRRASFILSSLYAGWSDGTRINIKNWNMQSVCYVWHCTTPSFSSPSFDVAFNMHGGRERVCLMAISSFTEK